MQVGLTFNLQYGEKENTPDPSGTGSSDFQAESNILETIERAGGVFEMLQKAQPDIPFATAGDCAGPFCEGRLLSARNRLSISSSGSGFIIQLCSMEVLKRSLRQGVPEFFGDDKAACAENLFRQAARNKHSLN